ncbi:MAG: hypothetical protein OEL55_00655, partial [Desulfobulbaceae bacterium]|nr:hypothetical protein [Desulfobulbaceae bacterium]
MRRGQQKITRRGWLIASIAAVLFVLLVVSIFVRLGSVDDQDLKKEVLAGANDQPALGAAVSRKNIYDRNCKELAVSFRLTSIYARPLEVDGIDKAASDIAAVLGVDKAGLSSLLITERSV